MVTRENLISVVKYYLYRLQNGYLISSTDDIRILFYDDYTFSIDLSLGLNCKDYVVATEVLQNIFSKPLVLNSRNYRFIKKDGSVVDGPLNKIGKLSDNLDIRVVFTIGFPKKFYQRLKIVDYISNEKCVLRGFYRSILEETIAGIDLKLKSYVVCYRDSGSTIRRKEVSSFTPDSAYEVFKVINCKYREGKDYTFLEIREQNVGLNDMVIEPEPKMVYSDSLDEYVIAGFTIEDEEEGTKHYTWYDDDCVYYWDEADDDYYMEVPKGAKLD